MTVGATLIASLLLALARPRTWALSLATFLLRGGILVVLAPIVVLPSAVALSNVLTPLLSTIVFHGFGSIALPLVIVSLGALLWLFGGGLVAAAVEAEQVRTIAADDEAWPAGRPLRGRAPAARPAWRVLTVRLLAHLPLLLALSWGAIRIVAVTYRELTVPSDVAVAIVLRVARGAPDAVAVVVGAWLLGEMVGAIAARRVILLGERVPRALGGAAITVLRRPLRCLMLTAVPLVALLVVLLGVGLAGSATWDALRAALSFGSDRVAMLVLLVALVGLFGAGLVLIGVISGWRATVWTVETAGTFGGSAYDPEGPWHAVNDSGTLRDLRPRGVDPDSR
jgi:hypothetical protein